MIAGQVLVGRTGVTAKVWDALATEARRGVFADGRLARSALTPDVIRLNCWLPQAALRD